MTAGTLTPDEVSALRAARLVWRLALWPATDQLIWTRARPGKGPDGIDNPAMLWQDRTAKKHEDGYGRYLSWLTARACLLRTNPSPNASRSSASPSTSRI